MRRLLIGLLLWAGLTASASAQTVILVRHAEKADAGADPALSPAGVERAAALAAALAGARLTQVLVTPLQRTRLTAEPVASAGRLTPQAVPLDGGSAAHVERVAARIRSFGPDAVVLVVGHSNTVPAITAALTGAQAPDMPDCEYDRLTTVILRENGPALVVGRYGRPSTC